MRGCLGHHLQIRYISIAHSLERKYIKSKRKKTTNITFHILKITLFFIIYNVAVLFAGIYGYHGNKKVPFLKITVAIPRLIAPAKRLLEQGFTCPGYSSNGFQAYESNIDFEVRQEL